MRLLAISLALLLAAPRQDDAVPFELAYGIILVKGSVNGKDGLTFIFDCGANQTILTPDTAKELGIKGTAARDANGTNVEIAKADALAIGGVSLKNVDIIIYDPPQAKPLEQMGKKYHGIVGYTFLSKFVVTLDYKATQIRLASPEPPIVLGMRIEETRVADIEKGSASEKAGFKAGDVLLKLNAITLAGAADAAAIVKVAKAGDALTFTVKRDKKELTLKLARP